MSHDLFMYHCWQVQNLLKQLDFDDFLPSEVENLVTILGTVYGRKIANTPRPPGGPPGTHSRKPLQVVRS